MYKGLCIENRAEMVFTWCFLETEVIIIITNLKNLYIQLVIWPKNMDALSKILCRQNNGMGMKYTGQYCELWQGKLACQYYKNVFKWKISQRVLV